MLTSSTSKMATGSWYFLSFIALTRQIRTAGVKTKAFRFVLWDKSVPSSGTSNFRLLFMMSGRQRSRCLSFANLNGSLAIYVEIRIAGSSYRMQKRAGRGGRGGDKRARLLQDCFWSLVWIFNSSIKLSFVARWPTPIGCAPYVEQLDITLWSFRLPGRWNMVGQYHVNVGSMKCQPCHKVEEWSPKWLAYRHCWCVWCDVLIYDRDHEACREGNIRLFFPQFYRRILGYDNESRFFHLS